ncbi:MAG: Gfo/Idh/MocA family protein [Planctomycetota bacterium]
MKRFRVALLGLAGEGRRIYEVLRTDQTIELAAVAERDGDLAVALGDEAEARAYDDYRRAIVESTAAGLDALFVALAPPEADEYLRLAAAQRVAVFAVPPVARAFEATAELAELFAQSGCPLVVGRTWQFEPAFMRLHNLPELAGAVYAASMDVTCAVTEPLGWRGDARRAGGGVLLHGGYEMVDAMVNLLGVPEEVFAATGLAVRPEAALAYDTEDAASVVFRYADDRTAALTCRRTTTGGDPAVGAAWSMTLCGSEATVVVTPESMTVTNDQGECVTRTTVRTTNRYAPAISVFLAALGGGVKALPSLITEHLATMAVIRAAYLSAKTGQTESPGRFLELTGRGAR